MKRDCLQGYLQDKLEWKLKEIGFGLDVRKRFFTLKVVRHWHRFSRENVDDPSLSVFKARLGEEHEQLDLFNGILTHGRRVRTS